MVLSRDVFRRALACAVVWAACLVAAGAEQQKITRRLIDAPRPPGKKLRYTAGVLPSTPPKDCPFPLSKKLTGVALTGRHKEYTRADTWYPSWAKDGQLYSPWTDGRVGKMGSSSGPRRWTTGHARITGDDPMKLQVVPLGLHKAAATPDGGAYPCGSLVHDGVWYYGTYCLDKKKHPWDIMGPFVGFRISRDHGKTWTDTPCTPAKPLFGESGKDGRKVKMGSPHVVDFGKNMQHSPDGKMYLTGHGATRRQAVCSWVSGDQVYLARVKPSPQNINDASKYEFFAGHDSAGKGIWVKDFSKIKPLVEWNDRAGCVTMTYNAALKKYLMCVTYGGATGNGPYDTWIVESDKITGPWKLVTYMAKFGEQAYFVNIPTKFISGDGRTAWLCYAHGWQHKKPDPPGSTYAMNLQEFRLLGPEDAPAKKAPSEKAPPNPLAGAANVARRAKATASSNFPQCPPAGAINGCVGGVPGDFADEWSAQDEHVGAWLRLTWRSGQRIDRVWLFDRPSPKVQITGAELRFSDGSKIPAGTLPDDARRGLEIRFPARTVTWLEVRVTATKNDHPFIGLSEIAVFAPSDKKD